jgi:hypothetical protein
MIGVRTGSGGIDDNAKYDWTVAEGSPGYREAADEPEGSALPTDRVFETGFDPLTGGFSLRGDAHFAVFDQWIEILPTDQIVPVEVTYDPQTGGRTVEGTTHREGTPGSAQDGPPARRRSRRTRVRRGPSARTRPLRIPPTR